MITVKILINGETIAEKHAHRIAEPDKDGKAQYRTDCNKIIEHKPERGAIPLVKKMLDLVDLEPQFYDLPKHKQYEVLQKEIEKRWGKTGIPK